MRYGLAAVLLGSITLSGIGCERVEQWQASLGWGDKEFSPPSHGKLTEEQVVMYLAVKERELQLLQQLWDGDRPPRLGEELLKPGQSALELGYDPVESQWVQDTVLAVRLQSAAIGMQEALKGFGRVELERLAKQRVEASDDVQRRLIDYQITKLENMLDEESEEDPAKAEALAHNSGLIEKHEAEIQDLEQKMNDLVFQGMGGKAAHDNQIDLESERIRRKNQQILERLAESERQERNVEPTRIAEPRSEPEPSREAEPSRKTEPSRELPPPVFGDTTPRIAYWYGKVNQHVENGLWKTDPDGSSGANIDKLTYCRKWYPRTLSVVPYQRETITDWKAAGNRGSYPNQAMSYRCVGG